MGSHKNFAKQGIKLGLKALNITFICFRCLLWSVFFFAILFSDTFFKQDHLDLLWVFLVLISIPVTLILIWKQFVSDIKLLRSKYASHLLNEVYNDLGGNLNFLTCTNTNNNLPPVTKEIFWNVTTGDEFRNFDSYVRMFLERRDPHALQMRRVMSKNDMKSLILNAPGSLHSIRIWETENLVSLDYDQPIDAKSIEGFSITKQTSIIKGESVTKKTTKHKGYSYPSLIFGKRNYRGKSTTTYHTYHQPDRIVNDYTMKFLIASPNFSIKQMTIRDNENLVNRIICDMKEMRIKQFYQ